LAEPVLVGLLDSGVEPGLERWVEAARAFRPCGGEGIDEGAVSADAVGHGSAIARIVLALTPGARLLNAQVFALRGGTSAAAAAAGLDWLARRGAAVVAMSFGLGADRAVLREACARARAAGCVLVGAAPARGAPVFPSSYPGVVRVTGDARCARREISHLATAQADFGACVRAPTAAAAGHGSVAAAGASIAVAHACGLVAGHFLATGERGAGAARLFLERTAAYHGPERKTVANAGEG
jgi:hypothetical protein